MEGGLAREMWRGMEPYHGMVYVSPEREAIYSRIGLEPGPMFYFATRAAALGPVPPELVTATFFNFFHPDLVRSVIPDAWRRAAPSRIVGARLAVADATLRSVLGDAVEGPEVAEAAELAREAALACPPGARPLYAAHAALPWAVEPHLALWQAQTMLREFRGDGHIAALLVEGSTGLEALITYEAAGMSPPGILQATRAWSDAEWDTARQGLRERGWLDAGGRLTEAGRAHRDRVERLTDELMLPPWRALGEARCRRLLALVRPLSRRLVESGMFEVPPTYWTQAEGSAVGPGAAATA